MSPIQQMLLGVGAVATKTYVDDVFSTYLWTGNATARSFNNGIDNTKGGLVWMKSRSNGLDNYLFDTERGVEKYLWSNTTAAEVTASSGDTLTAFNNNGFSIGNTTVVNNNNSTFAGWNFRKAPGFFTCLTYVGNGSNRTISHDLGCVPGMIILKNLDASDHWVVYHRGNADSNNAAHYSLRLNTTAAKADWFNYFQDTLPTATEFTLGTDSDSNGNGENFIAYLFAGGESTAATARSVDFDETGDYLSTSSSSSDFTMGTGDFTIECWVKKTGSNTNNGVCHLSTTSGGLSTSNPANDIGIFQNQGVWKFWAAGATQVTTIKPVRGVWTHLALVRHNGKTTFYVNGVKGLTVTDTSNYDDTYIAIAGYYSTGNYLFDGKISNFRVVKGTAVYTSSFRPTYEPLTNITNTVLLCCNNSSTTGSTVTPVTINANGDPTASTDSPFDDPAGFVFGDSGDQNVIKCGSYVGNGSATGPEINLGWEPQFLIVKQTNSSGNNWRMWDSMRGIVTGGNDESLYPSTSAAADSVSDRLELTPTGFKITRNDSAFNGNGDTYIFLAIRRPDGYVGKIPELGTDVFAMDTGNSSTTIPTFDTTFPVDFAISRTPASSANWSASARLIQKKYLSTNLTSAEASWSAATFDSNVGYSKVGDGSNTQAWMWKRHAGFDVVALENYDSSNGPTYTWHPHSLGKKPEMIWVKRRDSSQEWWVYHHGANGGTNPWNNYLQLHSDAAEGTLTGFFGESGPTATTFSLKRGAMTDGDFIFMLFASVDGISKVGYYDGSSTSSFLTITTGFQPRFLMVKRINDSGPWLNVDTTRGWVNGDDKVNYFNLTAASEEYGMSYPTSTGFVLDVDASFNMANNKYIYYCHA